MDLFTIALIPTLVAFGVIDYAALRIIKLHDFPMPAGVDPWHLVLWGSLAFVTLSPLLIAGLWQRWVSAPRNPARNPQSPETVNF